MPNELGQGGESQNSGGGQGDQAGGQGLGGQGDLPVREWMKDLPGPLQESKSLRKFAEKADLAKSYVELEGKLGKSVSIPDQSASQEDWGKFFSRTGRPDTPEGYEIPSGKLDASFEAVFRQRALAAGMNKAQAKVLYEGLVQHSDSQKAAAALSREQAEIEAQGSLKAAFGSNLDTVLAKANKAFESLFPQGFRTRVAQRGLSKDVDFIRALADIADQMGEDKLVPGSFERKQNEPDPYEWMRKRYQRPS